AGEAMHGRLLTEGLLDAARVGGRDALRVERAEAPLELERPGERSRHGHLLVEREADEQRERLTRDQPVRLVVVGEVQPVGRGHGAILDQALTSANSRTSARALARWRPA